MLHGVAFPLIDNQQAVTEAAKLITVFHRQAIAFHHIIVAAEGCSRHEQSRFRMIEVNNHRVGQLEFVWWEDELTSPTVVLFQ